MIANFFIFIFVIAASFAVLTLIASFVRYHLLTDQLKSTPPEDIDPKDIFKFRVMQELGGLHQATRPFTILLIEPELPADLIERAGDTAPDAWMEAFALKMREIMRDSDFTNRIGSRQVGVLGRFGLDKAGLVMQRVEEALTRAMIRLPNGAVMRFPVKVGLAAYPEHGERAVELMEASVHALAEVSGEGEVRYAFPPNTEVPSAAAAAPVTPPQAQSDILDPLTGILRRERIGTAMRKFVAKQRKEDLPVSAIFFSVDHFQKYLSHYSEKAVEPLLKGFADLLSHHTRETDLIARADLAEFLVVVDCRPAEALVVAQRLAAAARKMPVRFGSTNLKISVCAGVAGYPDHSGQTEEMYAYAQEALNQARNRGAGQASLYQAPSIKTLATPLKPQPIDSF
jgi:diguanylate cyclase (GGDEF)-like protein